MHGGWLIFLPIGLLLLMATMAPSTAELARIPRRKHRSEYAYWGLHLSSSVWYLALVPPGPFGRKQQVGAIKGGLTLLPTLNLTFDAMLAYAGKTFVPAHMSASYTWSEYPYVSVKGVLGAVLICAIVWTGMRLAGSPDRNRRLIAFGIFWYSDRSDPSLELGTDEHQDGRPLSVRAHRRSHSGFTRAGHVLCTSRRSQLALCAGIMLVIGLFTAWSYNRTRVWCGKTTLWNNRPQPDLSLWTSAVETNPDDTYALTSLALAYLRLNPPEADKALLHLNRALQLSEATQEKIAGR